jgi:hypothetical protein
LVPSACGRGTSDADDARRLPAARERKFHVSVHGLIVQARATTERRSEDG